MPIIGRSLDPSERKVAFQWSNQYGGQSLTTLGGQVIQTGSTLWMFMIPFPCTIQSGAVFNQGVSGAPQLGLFCSRFVQGSSTGNGATAFALGISNMVLTGFGTSGVQGLSGLPAQGSTLLNLLQYDTLFVQTSVANTAINVMVFELVVKKTQEIVSYNGISV